MNIYMVFEKNNFIQNSIKKDHTQTISEMQHLYNIKDDQVTRLAEFVDMIIEHNSNYNFIGKSTINDIWHRHILDSIQIIKLIDNNDHKFADFGSGCGLPGIVLSIAGLKEIHLIEKSYRKSEFLKIAKHLSQNRIYVQQSKIEELKNIKFNCILSRALAPLPKLLNYCMEFLDENGYCLFLKGKKLDEEIANCKNIFKFDFQKFQSITSKQSNIIKITNIKKL